MKPGDVEKKIKAAGWKWIRISGSHRHYKHPTKQGITTIPWHNADLPPKTLKCIEKQTGLKLR
ncbi:MAG: type II toxin-antitoxin system HicA family toxin [Thermoguttaceae bacterium]|nr:type II toxin-antitoxin system HicA family toxin [Thermoguttaceae bacterium]